MVKKTQLKETKEKCQILWVGEGKQIQQVALELPMIHLPANPLSLEPG